MSMKNVTMGVLAAGLALALGGCSTGQVGTDGNTDQAAVELQVQDASAAASSAEIGYATEDTGGSALSSVEPAIAVSSYVTVTTSDPASSAQTFAEQVENLGGRVEYSSTSDFDGHPYASVSARVPADRLQEALDGLAELGKVVSVSTSSEDLGQQKVDAQARVKVLEESVARLQDLMDQATSVDELIAAETSLTQRQAELDSMRDQLDWINDQVDTSSITADFSTEAPAGDGFLDQAWAFFLQSIKVVGYAILIAIPWAVLAGIVYLIVRAARKRRREKKLSNNKSTVQPREAADAGDSES